mmetsp:Transcript_8635/g.13552  ORF Transcript_8635/g.13552 Transcript_8635/m.13552 type:complete len:85 (+) Transcript_8635:68-322(+)
MFVLSLSLFTLRREIHPYLRGELVDVMALMEGRNSFVRNSPKDRIMGSRNTSPPPLSFHEEINHKKIPTPRPTAPPVSQKAQSP